MIQYTIRLAPYLYNGAKAITIINWNIMFVISMCFSLNSAHANQEPVHELIQETSGNLYFLQNHFLLWMRRGFVSGLSAPQCFHTAASARLKRMCVMTQHATQAELTECLCECSVLGLHGAKSSIFCQSPLIASQGQLYTTRTVSHTRAHSGSADIP